MGETGSVLYRVVEASVGDGADFCARSVVTRGEKESGSSPPTVQGARESKWTASRGEKIIGTDLCRLTRIDINSAYALSDSNSLVLGLVESFELASILLLTLI